MLEVVTAAFDPEMRDRSTDLLRVALELIRRDGRLHRLQRGMVAIASGPRCEQQRAGLHPCLSGAAPPRPIAVRLAGARSPGGMSSLIQASRGLRPRAPSPFGSLALARPAG